jgi:predicted nucleic acid-binding protein
MQVLRSLGDLASYLRNHEGKEGCFADTGFLYAVSYQDDRLHNIASQVLDVLAEYELPVHANVISRMEFTDLIFRKQITLGAIRMFDSLRPTVAPQSLFNLLKNIRDKNTANRREGRSYKIDEGQLKKLRKELSQALGIMSWKNFCETYSGKMLVNEWAIMEEEIGSNFVEVMDGGVSEEITSPLHWGDMVKIMGEHGLRGPDAMILNLFANSKFPLLITSDSDFESCQEEAAPTLANKAVFYLE